MKRTIGEFYELEMAINQATDDMDKFLERQKLPKLT